jgi:hypothetical protein
MAQRFGPGLVADLPRILHPLRFSAVFQCDHIKTQVCELALTLLYPPKFCTTRHASLFVCRDALKRAAMAAVVAQANFDDHCCVAVRHDQINFATAATVVTSHQVQALLFQQVQGPGFSQLTF